MPTTFQAPIYNGGFYQTTPYVATLEDGTPPADINTIMNIVIGPYTQGMGAFGVTQATWNGNTAIPETGPQSNEQDQVLLTNALNNGSLPLPYSPQQQYMILQNYEVTDIPGAQSFHSWFNYEMPNGNVVSVPYSVIDTALPARDIVAYTHEFAETTLDTFPSNSPIGGWFLGQPDGGEPADLAMGYTYTIGQYTVAALVSPTGMLITDPTAFVPPPFDTSPPASSPVAQPISFTTAGTGTILGEVENLIQEDIDLFADLATYKLGLGSLDQVEADYNTLVSDSFLYTPIGSYVEQLFLSRVEIL